MPALLHRREIVASEAPLVERESRERRVEQTGHNTQALEQCILTFARHQQVSHVIDPLGAHPNSWFFSVALDLAHQHESAHPQACLEQPSA
jgi:hypothetical protein